jgi:hypothetical protein
MDPKMMKNTFDKFVQANIDHAIEHPKAHAVITVAAAVAAVVVIRKFARKSAVEDPTLRSGIYA